MQSAYLFERKRKFMLAHSAGEQLEGQGRARINNELASGFMPGTSLSEGDSI